ncbi:SCO family protein [Leucothrix arctica]|uniref:Thioredoxin domain-containing protein n=1 Tax=Leucothrix arctica TaxID=1481894 RepID=A0A317CTB2_9GAMM|nr:SCO family protein [Leucothrix arctica]PWQ99552.1 hypothetical protein DKT75_00335 [Leucothrix arctica]
MKKIPSIIGLLLIALALCYAVFDYSQSKTAPKAAVDLTGPNAPVRGPLNTAELKHIELVDQDGKAFTLDELKGDTVLVNFMFAGCTTICPVQTVGLRDLHKELRLDPKKNRIKLLSISIAPLSDTPKQLKAYAQRFEIDTPSWRFAVTSQANTDELSEQFGVGVKPLGGDQLDHRSLLYLINHEGVLIQQYRGGVVNVERLKNELRAVNQIGR